MPISGRRTPRNRRGPRPKPDWRDESDARGRGHLLLLWADRRRTRDLNRSSRRFGDMHPRAQRRRQEHHAESDRRGGTTPQGTGDARRPRHHAARSITQAFGRHRPGPRGTTDPRRLLRQGQPAGRRTPAQSQQARRQDSRGGGAVSPSWRAHEPAGGFAFWRRTADARHRSGADDAANCPAAR